MRTINEENKTILLNQILKSEKYSKLSDPKNKFSRFADFSKKSKIFNNFYLNLITPYLKNEMLLSDLIREELCGYHSDIYYVYHHIIQFNKEYFEDYEYVLNPELKAPFLIQNIKQENRLIKSFKRFLILLRKEIQREINKKDLLF